MESLDIYQTLCNSESMFWKSFKLEYNNIAMCLYHTLGVLLNDMFILNTGSTGEGTLITSGDYGELNSSTLCYISDRDIMQVLCHVRVIDEGDTLPQEFDNYMYIQAERGEHTTDGFRKLRIIHSPQYYSARKYSENHECRIINMSVEHGYMSSSKYLASKVSTGRY